MTFTLLLFASLKDAARADHVTVQLSPQRATLADVLQACGEQHPALSPWLPHVKVALNCEYADADAPVAPGDEIALIPPVSGGA